MATTITHSAGAITPSVMDGYQASRAARTVVHQILNRSAPDVTFRAPGLRTGTFTLVFGAQSDAIDAYGVLSIGQVFTLTDPDVTAVGMEFVVADGDLVIRLDTETRSVWVIEVPFHEVIP